MKDLQIDALTGEIEIVDIPDAAPISVVVPTAVPMRNARLALLSAGLLAQVESMISSLPGDDGIAARINWEFAQTVRRDDQLVASMWVALGKTEAELDALFIAADAIN